MSYVRIDVNKPLGGGSPQSKSSNIVVVDLDEVAQWPNRDSKGIKMVGEIIMKPGKYVTILQATASSISLPITSEGEEDAVSFTGLPEFYHPGSSLDFDEFVANMTNKNLALGFRVGACDGEEPYYKFYGTPCAPLSLLIEGQNNNEATRNMVRFQQFQRSRTLPGRYFGTVTLATVNTVPADTTEVNVINGTGRYQLQDNTAATVITSLTNANDKSVYTLIGSGGDNPASVAASNDFILAGAVAWQGLEGNKLTVRAYQQGAGDFIFIEESRSE